MGAGLGKLKTDEPVARDAVAIRFRRGELPAADGLQREIGEILARAGGIEFGLRNISSGLDVDADSNANFALNRVASFFGNVGQDLVQDFAARERGGGRFWRISGWKSVRSQRRRGGSCGG